MAQLQSSLYRAIIQKDYNIAEERYTIELRHGTFSFRTVVHKTSFIKISNDYIDRVNRSRFGSAVFPVVNSSTPKETPACECAFLHEYFDHISKDGEICDEVLEKLCSCLDKGECSHVAMAKEDRHVIVTTSVTPRHVAIAANNPQVHDRIRDSDGVTSVFHLSPSHIAILKQNQSYLHGNVQHEHINVTEMVADSSSKLHFQNTAMHPLSVCAKQNDLDMVKFLLYQDNHQYQELIKALEYSFHMGEENVVNELFDYCYNKATGGRGRCNPFSESDDPTDTDILSKSILAATLRDKPELLEILEKFKLLSNAHTKTVDRIQADINGAFRLAFALGHDKCVDILRKHADLRDSYLGLANLFQWVVDFLIQDRHTEEQCKLLLRKLCQCGLDINKTDASGNTVLMANVERNIPEVIHALLQSGSDLNVQNIKGETALDILLKHAQSTSNKRYTFHRDLLKNRLNPNRNLFLGFFLLLDRTGVSPSEHNVMPSLKVLLFNNAVMTSALEKTYIEMAMRLDRHHVTIKTFIGGDETPSIVPLQDLLTPLLWECGFPVHKHLLRLLSFPELLRDYLNELTSRPISLQMQCRTVLRRHFPGRLLHEFVRLSDSPHQIQKYILISDLLQNHLRTC